MLLNKNQIKTKDLAFSAKGYLSERVVVKDVKLTYVKDKDNKLTEQVECVRYDCVDPISFTSFTLKVESTKPVVTAEQLEEADEPVYLEIPVDSVVIKPYAVEFGVAKVTITAPFVTLVK